VKALYVGIQTAGTTSQLRADTLRRIVPCDWTMIDTDRAFQPFPRWARSLWFRLRTGPAVLALNRLVCSEIGDQPYDVAWIDKGVCLWPSTIQKIRTLARRLIYYTPDTSFLANGSRFFRATARLYDLIVTTKSLEIDLFKAIIDKDRLIVVTQSYDSQLHVPRVDFEQKRKEVVLIGLHEIDRERCVQTMLSRGIQVRLGGKGWSSFVRKNAGNALLHFEGEEVFGVRYAELLSGAMIGLGLMTKRFPELHTTRTFEIPACGTAIATERNAETTSVFRDDEAVFFKEHDDLACKIQSLFDSPDLCRSITNAGTYRVQQGDFSNDRMIRNVMVRAGVLT
jgi:spore maturation protein CgeB